MKPTDNKYYELIHMGQIHSMKNTSDNTAILGNEITSNSRFKYLTECDSPTCVFNRSHTKIRQIYQSVVVANAIKINSAKMNGKLSILFYASFMCYQELQIIYDLHEYVDQIHLYDSMYSKIHSKNRVRYAIEEFVINVKILNPKIKIYLHGLIDDKIQLDKFDMICGIDIESDHNKNRLLMWRLAKHLSYNGQIILAYYDNPDIYIRVYKLASNINRPRLSLKFTYGWLHNKTYIRAMIKGKTSDKKYYIKHYNNIWTKRWSQTCTGIL